jgi:hypothetical protein
VSLTKGFENLLSNYFDIEDIALKYPKKWALLLKRIMSVTAFDADTAATVETLRQPRCFYIPRPRAKQNDDSSWSHSVETLVKVAGYSKKSDVESFGGAKVKIGIMFDAPDTQKYTLVEDMYIGWENDLGLFCRHILTWNGLLHSKLGNKLACTTLVLSHVGARAQSHQHPTGFWNYAAYGCKLYVLVDTIVAEKEGMLIRNDTTMKVRHLTLDEFLRLPPESACLAVINGSDESEPPIDQVDQHMITLGSMIVVPSRFSHEVFTIHGHVGHATESHLYGGMVGLCMPPTPTALASLVASSLVPKTMEAMAFRLPNDHSTFDAVFDTNDDTFKQLIHTLPPLYSMEQTERSKIHSKNDDEPDEIQ